jgi:hypothetical protein
VIGERQWMTSQERLVALPRAKDLAPAAHRIAGPNVQFSKQRECLGFVTRRYDAPQAHHRGCQVAACGFELGEMNVRRRKLR